MKNFYFVFILLLLSGCGSKPKGTINSTEKNAVLEPDYSGITIPPNIAPLNFTIKESGKSYFVKFIGASGPGIEISSSNKTISIPLSQWHEMLQKNSGKDIKAEIFIRNNDNRWSQYNSLNFHVAAESIDPFLYYRLVYPGYESWKDLSVNCRNLENFKTTSFIENSVVDENCVN